MTCISILKIGKSAHLIFSTLFIFIACFEQNIMYSSEIQSCASLSKWRKQGRQNDGAAFCQTHQHMRCNLEKEGRKISHD